MKTLSEIILKQNCINIYENQNEIFIIYFLIKLIILIIKAEYN